MIRESLLETIAKEEISEREGPFVLERNDQGFFVKSAEYSEGLVKSSSVIQQYAGEIVTKKESKKIGLYDLKVYSLKSKHQKEFESFCRASKINIGETYKANEAWKILQISRSTIFRNEKENPELRPKMEKMGRQLQRRYTALDLYSHWNYMKQEK